MRLISFIPIFRCCLSHAAHSERLQPREQEEIKSLNASVTILPDTIYEVYAIVSGILDCNSDIEHYLNPSDVNLDIDKKDLSRQPKMTSKCISDNFYAIKWNTTNGTLLGLNIKPKKK
jgi:hypothetical protein